MCLEASAHDLMARRLSRARGALAFDPVRIHDRQRTSVAAIDNLSKCIRLCSHSGPAHSPSLNTRHKTARPSHCGRAACLPSNVLQIPSSPIPTHPHVKSNVSAVMRAGAGAAEHPLRSFPEGKRGCCACHPASRPITPSTGPQPVPSPYPIPTQPLLSELNGDHHGDSRRS